MPTYALSMTVLVRIDDPDATRVAALRALALDEERCKGGLFQQMTAVLADVGQAVAFLAYPEAALDGQPGSTILSSSVGIPQLVADV